MSISSINYGSSILGASVRNINQQLTDLSTQLSTGKLSQTYSGMGTNEGFAIAARAQISIRAVEMRRAGLMKKLGVRSVMELMRLLIEYEADSVARRDVS